MAREYLVIVNVDGDDVFSSDDRIRVEKAALGVYDVRLPENVIGFVRQATLGAADDTDQNAGSVTTELGAMGNNRVVRVRTFEAAAAADRPFHLSVRQVSSTG